MPPPIDPRFGILLIHVIFVVLLLIAIVNHRTIESMYHGPYPVGCLLPVMILVLIVFSMSSAILVVLLLQSN